MALYESVVDLVLIEYFRSISVDSLHSTRLRPSRRIFFECVCSSHLSPDICCCLNTFSLSSSRTESMLSYGSMDENKFIMEDLFFSRAKWVFFISVYIRFNFPIPESTIVVYWIIVLIVWTKIPTIFSQCVVSCWLFMLLFTWQVNGQPDGFLTLLVWLNKKTKLIDWLF